MNKIKVLFILPSLRAGGAERVVSYLAQNLEKNLFDCTLVVIGYEKDAVYQIKGISVMYLGKKRVLRSIPKLFEILSALRPEIVFTAIAHLNVICGFLSIFFPKTKFVGREVNVLSVKKKYSNSPKFSGFFVGLLYKIGYRKLDRIICQSEDMKNDLVNNANLPESKMIVINNPISSGFSPKRDFPKVGLNGYKLITVGRLAKQKGHLRILNSLKLLKLPFSYTIIGDGPEKENIFEHAARLDLNSKIEYIPYTDKISKYLAGHHLFLQGSYVEGFPNALLESCAVGTPAVVFKAPGGIDEIIQEGVNGYIVNTPEEFSEKIELILKQAEKWSPLDVSNSVHKKYSTEKILDTYEKMLRDLI